MRNLLLASYLIFKHQVFSPQIVKELNMSPLFTSFLYCTGRPSQWNKAKKKKKKARRVRIKLSLFVEGMFDYVGSPEDSA